MGMFDEARRQRAAHLQQNPDSILRYWDAVLNSIPDASQYFAHGVNFGTAGTPVDLATLPQTLAGVNPEQIPGTSDYFRAQAGVPAPQGIAQNLGYFAGQVLAPGPGEVTGMLGAAKAGGAALAGLFGVKSRNANKGILALAQKLEAEGKTPEEIWSTTFEAGQPWRRWGKDWIYEEPTPGWSLDPTKFEGDPFTSVGAPLDEAYDAPELFENYPGFPIDWLSYRRGSDWSGAYDADTGTAMIMAPERQYNRAVRNPSEGINWDAMNQPEPLGIAAHEVGHGVAEVEGLPKGTSPRMVNISEMTPDELDWYNRTVTRMIKRGTHINDADKTVRGRIAMDRYERNAGEAFARMFSDRRDFTREQIGANFPRPDVAEDSLIWDYERGGTSSAIPFWHGSAKDYPEVDFSHIGSGEGAQMMGWGYYGADERAVGEGYRNSVSRPLDQLSYKGVPLSEYPGEEGNIAAQLHSDMTGSKNLSFDAARARLAEYFAENEQPEMIDILRGMKQEDFGVIEHEGSLYRGEYGWSDPAKEAATPLTGEDMLDLDAPIAEQSPAVQEAVQRAFSSVEVRPLEELSPEELRRVLRYADKDGEWDGVTSVEDLDPQMVEEIDAYRRGALSPEATGRSVYIQLADLLGGDEKRASELLRDSGVPGSRYLDGFSRTSGGGTRDYVMFDEKGVRLLERNGKPIKKKGMLE